MNNEYDLRMQDTEGDEFDEVEETTEYNDVDEDDGEYEYEDDAVEEEESEEEEYPEEEEYADEEYDDYGDEDYEGDEFEEEYPEEEYAEEEEYPEEEYAEEEEEYPEEEYAAAPQEDYNDRFEQILSELKNLNQNLGRSSAQPPAQQPYGYPQPYQPGVPNQASPNFSCSYNVPQPTGMQYADPVLSSEVSRIRDEVLRSNLQQSMQQNNTVLAEISRLREEMNKSASQNLQYEIMQLKHDLAGGGRYQQPAPVQYVPQPVPQPAPQPAAQPAAQPAQSAQSVENLFMQNELARLKDDMSRSDLMNVNGEVARLREEMTKKELAESMRGEITAMKRDLDQKSELTNVREEMNRLKQELVDAINEKKHRQTVSEPAVQYVPQPAPPAGRNEEVMEMIRQLREDMRREREEARDRERELERSRERELERSREERRREESLPTQAAKADANAMAVLEEIKKLREEVAQTSINSSAVISKKIDSVIKGGAEEEKRTQEILRAIGKMFVQSNNAMKGMTDKNETMLKSFTEEIRKNVDELAAVRDEIEKADLAGVRDDAAEYATRAKTDIENMVGRTGREIASEIGEQLGALAKDIISKVGDKDKQEQMYNSLIGVERKLDASVRAQAKSYQDSNRVAAGMVKLAKENKAEILAKLDEAGDSMKQMKQQIAKLDELGAGTERAVNFVVDSLTGEIDALKQDLKHNPSAYTDAGKVLAEVEQLKAGMKALSGGAATKQDVENTAVRLRNSIMQDIKGVDLTQGVSAALEKIRSELAEGQKSVSEEIAATRAAYDETGKKNAVMFNGIAKMIAKNNGILQDVLAETQKSLQAVAAGGKLTGEQIDGLKRAVAEIAGRDLAELNSIKKALTKLDDTEEIVADINARMAQLNKEVARTMDELKAEIADQLTDIDRYSDVNKVLELVKNQVNETVSTLMSGGIGSMKAEISNEVNAAINSSVADIMGGIANANDRVVKAVESIDVAAVDPLIAQMKRALAASEGNQKQFEEFIRRNERMEKEQEEQNAKSLNLFTGMAKALAKTNDTVSLLRAATQKNLEDIAAKHGATAEEIRQLKNTVTDVTASYEDELREIRRQLTAVSAGREVIDAVDNKLKNLSEDTAKAVASLKEDVARRIAEADKSERVKKALDEAVAEIKRELAANDSGERVAKAVERIDIAAIDPLIAQMKEALAATRDNQKQFEEYTRRSERLEKLQEEQNAKAASMFGNMAKALSRTNDTVGLLRAATQKNLEQIAAKTGVTGEELGKLKGAVADAAASYGNELKEIRKELTAVAGGQTVIAAVDDKLKRLGEDTGKAIAALKEDVARRIADADKTEKINKALDEIAGQLKKELDANLQRDAAAYTELSKRTQEIRTRQDEQARRDNNAYQSIARAVMATRGDVSRLAANVNELKDRENKSFTELQNSLTAASNDTATELKSLVDGELNKLYTEIRNKLEGGEFNEHMMKQIASLKAVVRESTEAKAEELSKNMEFQLNGLLTQLTSKNAQSNQTVEAIGIKLNELSNALAKDNNEQINAVLKTMNERMNQLTDEIRANPAASSEQLAKRIAGIKQEIGARIDQQEAKVLDTLNTQVRDIKTSLVDVIGQNEVIDSIAKSVRDTRQDIRGEMAKLRTDFEDSSVSSKLVQELISQINLLSEYMLQDNKAGDTAAVATQIAELKNKIAASSSDKDLAEIKDELIRLRSEMSRKPDGDTVKELAARIAELAEAGRSSEGASPELDKVIGSIEEMNDQVQNLAKAVDLLKNKDMSSAMQDKGDNVRMRATQVMLDKLTEIKFALEDAIRKSGNRQKGIEMVKAIDKLTNNFGFEAGAPVTPGPVVGGGAFTRSLDELTDDLNDLQNK